MRHPRAAVLGSFLAVAGAALALVPLWRHERNEARVRGWNGREAAGAPSSTPGQDDVEALAGDVETANGLRLTVRLTRLHAQVRQQRFDAQALAARLGLEKGEPFVCEIGARGAGSVAGGSLRAVVVDDEQGRALATFPVPSVADNEPADPLAVLLAPPSIELGGGTAVSVILWGRAPGAGARWSGLGGSEVALAPTHIGSRELDTALARIDAQSVSAPGAPK